MPSFKACCHRVNYYQGRIAVSWRAFHYSWKWRPTRVSIPFFRHGLLLEEAVGFRVRQRTEIRDSLQRAADHRVDASCKSVFECRKEHARIKESNSGRNMNALRWTSACNLRAGRVRHLWVPCVAGLAVLLEHLYNIPADIQEKECSWDEEGSSATRNASTIYIMAGVH